MEVLEPIWSFKFGTFKVDIVPEVVVQWIIMLAIIIVALLLTRNLSIKPNKRQSVVESLYTSARDLIADAMGEDYLGYIPYIGTLAVFLLLMNFMALIGLPSPTKNFSVTVGLAITTFFMIQFNAIKRCGLKGYFFGYIQPSPAMAPLNILERVMILVSLSLRLFGNILAGTVIVDLCYQALGGITPFLQFIIPIPLHLYFDIFDGGIQTLVFIMLTMINIKMIAEHSDTTAEHH